MRLPEVFLTIAFCLVATSIFCQSSLSNRSENALKKAIGYDLNGYKLYSYPTNNFGIGTSCVRRWDPNSLMVCDMIKCFGLENTAVNSYAWKSVNGFAFFGEGGTISMNDTINNILGIGMLLPKVFKVLSLDFNGGINNSRSVKVTIDSALKRHLIYDSLVRYVRSLPDGSQMRSAFNNRRLALVTSDFVLLGYKVEINPKDSFGINLTARLDSLLTSQDSIQVNKEFLSLNVSRSANGSYTILSKRPVVLAVSVRRQRSLGVHSNESNFDQWEQLELTDRVDPTLPLVSIRN